jgi:hypothetical protein
VVAGAFERAALVAKCDSLKKLFNIYAYVLCVARKWRVHKRGQAGGRQIVSSPDPDETEAAELLIQKALEDISVDHIPSLLPEVIAVRDKLGFERKIILVGGRVKAKYRIGYDKDGIPVLPSKCHLSDMYLQQAHEVDHGGVNSMVMRTRSQVWIIQGAKVAQQIKNSCYKCRLLWKPLQKQKMPPMPEFRLGPQPVFSTTAVDLFGPLEYRDMVKKRTTGKGWGVIFICTATSAIHLELAARICFYNPSADSCVYTVAHTQ